MPSEHCATVAAGPPHQPRSTGTGPGHGAGTRERRCGADRSGRRDAVGLRRIRRPVSGGASTWTPTASRSPTTACKGRPSPVGRRCAPVRTATHSSGRHRTELGEAAQLAGQDHRRVRCDVGRAPSLTRQGPQQMYVRVEATAGPTPARLRGEKIVDQREKLNPHLVKPGDVRERPHPRRPWR
jgi:hypothetical protein